MTITCDEYVQSFRESIKETDLKCSTLLYPGNYRLVDGGRLLTGLIDRQLHPNVRLLLETLYNLNPASVWEVGCAAGINLHNLKLLLPEIELHATEICPGFLELINEIFPDLGASIEIDDASSEDYIPPEVDIAFSHAVLMHINPEEAFRRALGKMLYSACRQVVLLENWATYNFHEGALSYLNTADCPSRWKKPNFYQIYSPELGRYHLMVISTTPLNYPLLFNYKVAFEEPERREWINDGDKVGCKDWMIPYLESE